MSYVWRMFKSVFGITLVLGIAYFLYNYSTAEGRVRALCPQIKSGMSIAALREFANHHGLGPGRPHEGVNYLVEKKSYGRHGCRVVVASGVVQESTHTYAD